MRETFLSNSSKKEPCRAKQLWFWGHLGSPHRIVLHSKPCSFGDLTSCVPLESQQQRTMEVGGLGDSAGPLHSAPEWTSDQNKGIFFFALTPGCMPSHTGHSWIVLMAPG